VTPAIGASTTRGQALSLLPPRDPEDAAMLLAAPVGRFVVVIASTGP